MKNARSSEEINVCQFAEAKQLEIQIKELEENIRSRLRGVQLERFNANQVNWQSLSEKDCEFESDFYEGAPIYLAIKSECLQNHYRARLQTIRNYLCPEQSFTGGCEPSNYVNKIPNQLDNRPASGDSVPIIEHSTDKPKKITNTKRFR